jgi:hypothetical protein
MRERRGLPATCSGGCKEERGGDGRGLAAAALLLPVLPRSERRWEGDTGLVYSSKNSQMICIYLQEDFADIYLCI